MIVESDPILTPSTEIIEYRLVDSFILNLILLGDILDVYRHTQLSRRSKIQLKIQRMLRMDIDIIRLDGAEGARECLATAAVVDVHVKQAEIVTQVDVA